MAPFVARQRRIGRSVPSILPFFGVMNLSKIPFGGFGRPAITTATNGAFGTALVRASSEGLPTASSA